MGSNTEAVAPTGVEVEMVVEDAETSESQVGLSESDGQQRYGKWAQFSFCLYNWRFVKYEDKEVTGFIMSGASRGPISAFIAVYSVLALTTLAQEVQDCETRRVDFFGASLLTSSVVSFVLTVEGVVNALFSPIIGSLADGTDHRTFWFRMVMTTLALSVFAMSLVVFGRGEIWSLMTFAIILVFAALLYEIQGVLHSAYLPEISHGDDKKTVEYSSKTYTLANSMQVTFLVLTIGLALVFGVMDDSLVQAQIGGLVSFGLWMIWGIGMMFLLDRPKPQKTRSGICGLPRLYRLVKLTWSKYTQLGIFLIAYSFYITGCNALVALATSYALSELGLSGLQFNILVALVLVFTVPGAMLIRYVRKRAGNLKLTLLAVIAFWIFTVASIPVLLVGEPDFSPRENSTALCPVTDEETVFRKPTSVTSIMVYVEALFWGISIGTVYPASLAFFSQLCPGGEEGSFFGLKTLSGKIFSFAPALMFTVINENTENARIAITSIIPFLVIGFIVLIFVDLKKAAAEIKDTLHLRHGHKGNLVLAEEMSHDQENHVMQ